MFDKHLRAKEREFTSGQLMVSILVNLVLLVLCYLAYQAAYNIEHRGQWQQLLQFNVMIQP